MKTINYESYYYSFNIAGYEGWQDETLFRNIERAKEAIAKMDADIYADRERLKKYLPPRYIGEGYRWARHVIFTFEQELKKRGSMEKDENDLFMEGLWNDL